MERSKFRIDQLVRSVSRAKKTPEGPSPPHPKPKPLPVRISSSHDAQIARIEVQIREVQKRHKSELEKQGRLTLALEKRGRLAAERAQLVAEIAAEKVMLDAMEREHEEQLKREELEVYPLQKRLRDFEVFFSCGCNKPTTIVRLYFRKSISTYCKCCEMMLPTIMDFIHNRGKAKTSSPVISPKPVKSLSSGSEGSSTPLLKSQLRFSESSRPGAARNPTNRVLNSRNSIAKNELGRKRVANRVSIFKNHNTTHFENLVTIAMARAIAPDPQTGCRSAPLTRTLQRLSVMIPGTQKAKSIDIMRPGRRPDPLLAPHSPSNIDLPWGQTRPTSNEPSLKKFLADSSFGNRNSLMNMRNSILSKLILNSNKSQYSRTTVQPEGAAHVQVRSQSRLQKESLYIPESRSKLDSAHDIIVESSQDVTPLGLSSVKEDSQLQSCNIESFQIPTLIESYEKI